MSFINAKIVVKHVNPLDYHGGKGIRGKADYIMSSSELRLFRHCPSRWLDGYEPTSSESKEWGDIIDCRLLTPDQWGGRFAVTPATYPAPENHEKVKKGAIKAGDPLPWNGNATYCREWEIANERKQIVRAADHDQATVAVSRFLRDEVLSQFLACSDTQVHVTAEWKDKATGLVIPCQCLIDFAPRKDTEWRQCLGDLKSTRSAHPAHFLDQAYRYGYHIQAAFDLDMFNAATGEERTTWLFACQENYPPYQTGREMMDSEFMELGRFEYEHALKRYSQCLDAGIWPDYDTHHESVDGWTVMRPTPWMMNRSALLCHTEYQTAETEPETTEETNDDNIP